MTSKQKSQEEMLGLASALELLAGIKREVEVLLHMAKKKTTTIEELHEKAYSLFDKTYTLELELISDGEDLDL